MTIGEIAERPAARRPYAAPASFRKAHPWDHDFFDVMVLLIWIGILGGFAPQIVHRYQQHAPSFPVIVDVHAVVFVIWLCVLTAQVLLVRFGRTDLHRQLGKAWVYLFVVVCVIGPATAVVFQRFQFGTPRSNPSFISVQFGDMIAFTVLGTAALLLRRVPQAHKRLLLLAVIFISDAGWARWWGGGLHNLLGSGATGPDSFWATYIELYLGDVLLVGLLGVYDWITRRRLHPVFVFGASFGLGLQLVATWLLLSPWWKPVATALIGH